MELTGAPAVQGDWRWQTAPDERLMASLLKAAAFTPHSLQFPNAWVGHLPFASWLIANQAPRIFVELGTHTGNSFFSFCQSVVEAGITAHTRCYAVDTWKGDEHASHYSESVFGTVEAYHRSHYAEFSRLLRMTFDEARDYFSDASIDLIHIDGLHTYDAVRYDFETWLPKLAPGAVVLFHDTNVRERNFGVWKLWNELQRHYPSNLEFVHSHGLGVLQLNDAPADRRLPWLQAGSPDKRRFIDYFAALGSRMLDRYHAHELRAHVDDLNRNVHRLTEGITSRDGHIANLTSAVAERDARLAQREGDVAQLAHALADRERMLGIMTTSHSWRLTLPLREARRWLGAPAQQARRYRATWRGRRPVGRATRSAMRRLFDADWYLATNPDVRSAGIDPLKHFARRGWSEGRNPHPLFDVRWYLDTNPDVRAAGVNPLEHFLRTGGAEGRRPHPLFDASWYLEHYPDVRAAGINPLVHYLESGAAENRNPHPQFDAGFYVAQHPEAAPNPLVYHLLHGAARGWSTSPMTAAAQAFDIAPYLPGLGAEAVLPPDVEVDIVIPVYRGLDETRHCLDAVFADTERPPGVIRVIDDCSPEPELSEWLATLAESGAIALSRNTQNLGFVRSANRGMLEARDRDVLLLNSDTEVTPGFLRRLAAHAYASPRVGTVTPFSNTGGEMCGFPGPGCRPLPPGHSAQALDDACRAANAGQAVEIPTGVGFCMYLRRKCLDEIGLFDADAFGRGYGEETDFCQRARAKGWRHLLACDTFVYHIGEVSFGQRAPERDSSWATLVDRHPTLAGSLRRFLDAAPATPPTFAATVSLFGASTLPTILILNHSANDDTVRHVEAMVTQAMGLANVLCLFPKGPDLELSVPSMPGHPTLCFPAGAADALLTLLRAYSISRVHVQHWLGFREDFHQLVGSLGAPVDLTLHDYVTR